MAVTPSSTIRLALLLCDTPIPPVLAKHGDYREIFDNWLKRTPLADSEFALDSFDVVNEMKYPPEDVKYDGIILTGAGRWTYLPVTPTSGQTLYHSCFCTRKH